MAKTQAERRKQILEGSIGSVLVGLAVPITLGNLLQTGYFMTDAFWVGRLGASAVAAVAVSFPMTFLVIAFGSGFAFAGAVLCAQYMGAGDQDKVNHVAAQTMTLAAITSAVLGALGFAIAPWLLSTIGVAPEVYDGALGFMRTSFVGIIFVFMYAMFQSLMRGIGQTKLPLFIVAGTVLLNFALDPLFIFGYGPIKPEGVMGAALATLATQALASAIGIGIFLRGRHGIQLRLRDFRPDPPYIARAFKLGLPGSVELSMRGLGPMVMSFLATSFGTMTVATYGVGTNILQVITIPAMGVSMAVSTIAGQNMGAGQITRAGRATVYGSVASFLILTLAGVLAFIFAEPCAAFFVPHDQDVIDHAAKFLRIMCLSWGFIGLQLSIISTYRAAGKMVMAMIVAFVSQVVFQLPVAYILSKHTSLGTEGLWWAFPLTNVSVAIVSVIWFATGSWKKSASLTRETKRTIAATDQAIIEEGIKS